MFVVVVFNLIFALFLFLFISHYFKKTVHGPGPWQGVHRTGPWKWSMDPVQGRGPWTPGPCFVFTPESLRFVSKEQCISRCHLGFRWLGTLCMNYFSVVFVTRVNFAGVSFTRRHVKRAFQSVFLVNLFFNYTEYHIWITIKANQTKHLQ